MNIVEQRDKLRKGTQPNGASLIPAANDRARMVLRNIGGAITPYVDNKPKYISKGYNYNDLIYMVIKRIVDKAILAPWAVYKVVDEKAYKQAKAMRSDLTTAKQQQKYKDLMTKALEPYEGDEDLNNLLTYPNEENTLSKHHAMLWTYKLATGDYFENWITADNGRPLSLEYMPSQHTDVVVDNGQFPMKVAGYILNAGMKQPFDKDEVLHEYYPNLDWSVNGEQFTGMSPIKAQLRRTQRNNLSQEKSGEMINNGGERGVVFLKLPPDLPGNFNGELTESQTNEMKEKYDEMTRPGTTGSTMFSGYEVGFQRFGLTMADMQQMEMEQWDMRMIAACYAAPSELFNDSTTKTFANAAEAGKALILSAVLPLLTDREASFNRQLRKLRKYKDGSVVVSYDLSQYSELEINRKDQAEYLNTAWWLTPNEKRVIMGETKQDDENMDKVLVPSNFVPLEDLYAEDVQPLTTDVNNLNQNGVNDYNQQTT